MRTWKALRLIVVGAVMASGLSLAGLAAGPVSTAFAASSPIRGGSSCSYTPTDDPADPGFIQSCTPFSGTIGGIPYTGPIEAAVELRYGGSLSCTSSVGAVRPTVSVTAFAVVRGFGAYAGVTGSGVVVVASFEGAPLSTSYEDLPGPCGPLDAPAPVLQGGELPPATLGQSYSTTVNVTGGSLPLAFRRIGSLGKMPKGLKLNHATGSISGVPKKKVGTFTFTIQVRDASKPKQTSTATFTIAVG